MEDQDEDIKLNVDQFMDSYARDTTVDELKEVCLFFILLSPSNPLTLPADSRADAQNRRDTQSPRSALSPEDRNPHPRQDQLRLYRATWMALPRPDILLPLKPKLPGQW